MSDPNPYRTESRVRAVSCPHCGAASGRPCRTGSGNVAARHHMQRRGVVDPSVVEGKQGVQAATFDAEQTRCARCGETPLTAPARAPFYATLVPPACTPCLAVHWELTYSIVKLSESSASPSS